MPALRDADFSFTVTAAVLLRRRVDAFTPKHCYDAAAVSFHALAMPQRAAPPATLIYFFSSLSRHFMPFRYLLRLPRYLR